MKPFQLLALFLALGCAQAPAQNDQNAPQPRPATPPNTEAQARIELMDQIERQVRLPEGAGRLDSYARYYAWQQREDGFRKVVAVYQNLTGERPGRHWVAENELPLIMDGGCGVIALSYDLAAQRIEHVSCNGVA